MTPYDDDSDCASDGEELGNTHLGLADGLLEGDDEENPLVSRIGGRPAWLPLAPAHLPPHATALCAYCEQPMQLLVEIFAPLDGSPLDRNLLVWGCARAQCQRRGTGSLRAVRMVKHNARWAAKLEKQRARREARAAAAAEQQRREQEARQHEERKARGTNPFAMGGKDAAAPGGASLFGGSLFGGGGPEGGPRADPLAEPRAYPDSTTQKASGNAKRTEDGRTHRDGGDEEEYSTGDSDDETSYDDDARIAEELAIKASLAELRTELGPGAWAARAPSYRPPLYLSTMPEPAAREREAEAVPAAKARQAEETGADMGAADGEAYEKMLLDGVDGVFERFVRRLGPEARQVVRYEYGGQPLPFSASGPLYRQLWPHGTKDAPGPFDASSVPPCPQCGAPRVFELQLMPNLVNLLRRDAMEGGEAGGGVKEAGQELGRPAHDRDPPPPPPPGETPVAAAAAQDPCGEKKDAVESQRESHVAQVLGVGDSGADSHQVRSVPPVTGLVWSTVVLFVCSADCSPDGSEGWAAEWVGMQEDRS
ncbi:hypothetical protein MSPP1_002520 [Malassezia sp. CBS 17886]|nr:hypothetical protein MSPP1_002520 [Malassezia sp. CBS 17886]